MFVISILIYFCNTFSELLSPYHMRYAINDSHPMPGYGIGAAEVVWNRQFYSRRDVLSPWKVKQNNKIVFRLNFQVVNFFFCIEFILERKKKSELCYGCVGLKILDNVWWQGGRDARSEQKYKHKDGMVEFALPFCLLISGGIANMALEDLFWEKKAHLIFSLFKLSNLFLSCKLS